MKLKLATKLDNLDEKNFGIKIYKYSKIKIEKYMSGWDGQVVQGARIIFMKIGIKI